MEFHNSSRLQAACAGTLFKDGSNGFVIIAKGSWQIPENGQLPKLLAKADSLPIQETDTFTGEPGLSAPVYENDFAAFKPYCDVIMHACAHAPAEQTATRVQVGLQLNQINKHFIVTGKRQWCLQGLRYQLSEPTEFHAQSISYDLAFGGMDTSRQDEGQLKVCMTNPVGRSYLPFHTGKDLVGQAGPQTEQCHDPIRTCAHLYPPQSFGPIARNWQPRMQYGGTYDQHWIDHIRPFLPDDFDERFYQCAPPDQQTRHLQGGETVILTGLHPQGIIQFDIPQQAVYMAVIDDEGTEHLLKPLADTLIIEPEFNRFSLVWRASWPLRRSPEEVGTILVGTPTKAWRRAKMLGKTYMPDKGKSVG